MRWLSVPESKLLTHVAQRVRTLCYVRSESYFFERFALEILSYYRLLMSLVPFGADGLPLA